MNTQEHLEAAKRYRSCDDHSRRAVFHKGYDLKHAWRLFDDSQRSYFSSVCGWLDLPPCPDDCWELVQLPSSCEIRDSIRSARSE
jgi:hypothetical protein